MEGFMGLNQGFLAPCTPSAKSVVPPCRTNRSGVEGENNAAVGSGESTLDLNQAPSELGLDDLTDLFPEELLAGIRGREAVDDHQETPTVADQTSNRPITEPINYILLNQEKHKDDVFTCNGTHCSHYKDEKSDSREEVNSRKRKNTDINLTEKQGKKPKKRKVWPKIADSIGNAKKFTKIKTPAKNHSTPKVRTPKKVENKKRAAKRATVKVQTGDKIPESVPQTCKRALNFTIPSDVGKSIGTIDHQYEGREKELVGPSTVTGLVAESKQCPESVLTLVVYQRKLRENDCQRNSKKVGPNFPRICKKVRTKNRRARNISSLITMDRRTRKLKRTSYGSQIFVKSRKVRRLTTRSNKFVAARSNANDRSVGFRSSGKRREINPTTTAQNRGATRDPKSPPCLQSLLPVIKHKKKRSYRLISRRFTGLPNSFLLQSTSLGRVDAQPIRGLQHRFPVASAVAEREDGCPLLPLGGLSDKIVVQSAIIEEPREISLVCDELLFLNEKGEGTNEGCNATFEITKRMHNSGREHILYSGGLEGNETVRTGKANGEQGLVPWHPKTIVSLENKKHKEDMLVSVRKPKKELPKVDIDPETERVWKLLLVNPDYKVEDEGDAEKEKLWEQERNLFSGRVNTFTTMMHGILGDRRFSPWKGSVLDSVVGVFLTQNVSDNLSSSAFLCLAARFPVKPAAYYQKNPIEVEKIAWHPAPVENDTEVGSSGKERLASNENSVNSPIPNKLEREKQGLCLNISCDSVETNAIVSNSQVLSECNPVDELELTMGRGSVRDLAGPETESTHEKKNIEKKQDDSVDCANSEKLERLCLNTVGDSNDTDALFRNSQVLRECSSEDGLELTMGQCFATDHRAGLQTESPEKENKVDTPIPRKADRVERGACSNTLSNTIDTDAQVLPECSSKDRLELTMGKCYITDQTAGLQNKTSKNKNKVEKKQEDPINWDDLRKTHGGRTSKATSDTMDSVDWAGVMRADVNVVAAAIKVRGQYRQLAGRIQACLERVAKDHGSLDLEWLRDVPPEKAKEYLLSYNGLGLKSVECLRLLSLYHHAFPVDTNVGRVAVRLGWVPLVPLPGSLELHLLDQYPLLDKIQIYLWPRLRHLDGPTLFSLHYHMITFGKVFCTKKNPNCGPCPLKAECKYYASREASARLALPRPQKKHMGNSNTFVPVAAAASNFAHAVTKSFPKGILAEPENHTDNFEPIIEYPASEDDEHSDIDIEDLGRMNGHGEYLEMDIEDMGFTFEDNIPTEYDWYLNLSSANVEMSKAMVPHYGSVSARKWKEIARLRTIVRVYELPDDHPILQALQLEKRDPMDLCPYLLAPWFSGESGTSNNDQIQGSGTVPATILIPLRTATRGAFPLSGTYFQINEVFADYETSKNPLNVPREYLCELKDKQRNLFCGAAVSGLFRDLTLQEIVECFAKGSICVRAFNRKSRWPGVLSQRFHVSPSSKAKKGTPPPEGKDEEQQKAD